MTQSDSPANPQPSEGLELKASPILDARWRIFLRVAEAGSLSKAAAALDMPQSMVSRAITQLERQCGERLFQRTGRGVLLTELGTQLRPRVLRLAADADELADDIRNAQGQPVGEVLLGLLPSAVRRFTGPLCAAVRAQMPGVRLHLVEGASAQLEEQLREGRLDMATVPREDAAAIGDHPLLARMPLQLLGRAGDPLLALPQIALASLSGLPLVLPARPHPLRARLDRLAAEGALQLLVATEADSVHLQYEVAAAGGGYAIAAAAEPPDPRLASSRIVAPELERFVVLAVSPRRPHTRATREVQRLLCQIAAGMRPY
ncbi:LysR family transcriptional regulator [Ideonella sp.]|uniref:LysR family transcriptional regulator n=1 Tax=Ideonella sp. TaxID=1929293 RepID=UPI003BB5DEBF